MTTMTQSPSQMGMWVRCQAQWQFRYIDGLRQPPNVALAFGKAFDTTSDTTYRERMATDRLLGDEDVKTCFSEAWDVQSGEVENWYDDKPGELKDQGVVLAGVWRDRVGSRINPVDVQRHVKSTFKGIDGEEIEIQGYIDVVDKPEAVELPCDTKTSAKRWSTGQAYQSLQALAYPLLTGTDRMQFHVGVRKKAPEIQILTRSVLPEEKTHFIDRAILTKRSIEATVAAGSFVPNRDGMLCSRRWCGYWGECERRYGGRVRP